MTNVRNTLLHIVAELITHQASPGTFNPVVNRSSPVTAVNGNQFTAVSRSLPALAAIACNIDWSREFTKLTGRLIEDELKSVLEHSFNEESSSFWQHADRTKIDQRQVEAFFVSIAVWLLQCRRYDILAGRHDVWFWMRLCTIFKDVPGNWICFRMFTEMVLADEGPLKCPLDKMLDQLEPFYLGDGWFTDAKGKSVIDYYSAYVFNTFLLMVRWKYGFLPNVWEARLQQFLTSLPMMFDSSGKHVKFGRSLIYRWSVLVPMVLAYAQQILPWPACMLKWLIESQVSHALSSNEIRGHRLTTRLAEWGSEMNEAYVDPGHPYWAMLLGLLFLPEFDSLDAVRPISRKFKTSRLLLPSVGLIDHDQSMVKLYLKRNESKYPENNFKYNKFVYCSDFPFGILDNQVILHGEERKKVFSAEISQAMIDLTWSTKMGNQIRSWIIPDRLSGVDYRGHKILIAPGYDVVEYGYRLPVTDAVTVLRGDNALVIQSGKKVVGIAGMSGYDTVAFDHDDVGSKGLVVKLVGANSKEYKSVHYAGFQSADYVLHLLQTIRQ